MWRSVLAGALVFGAVVAYAAAILHDFGGRSGTAGTAYELGHALLLFALVALVVRTSAVSARTPQPRLGAIRAVVSDVDGVLTDGGLIRTASGDLGRIYNSKDGYAHAILRRAGVKTAWISSTKEARSVEHRAAELKVGVVNTAPGDKGPRFLEVCRELGVDPADAVFIGDDEIDLPAMALAGLAACPADAVARVRATADIVLETPGGRGAFRELTERIVAARAERGSAPDPPADTHPRDAPTT